jgi:hypothetical protein
MQWNGAKSKYLVRISLSFNLDKLNPNHSQVCLQRHSNVFIFTSEYKKKNAQTFD